MYELPEVRPIPVNVGLNHFLFTAHHCAWKWNETHLDGIGHTEVHMRVELLCSRLDDATASCHNAVGFRVQSVTRDISVVPECHPTFHIGHTRFYRL